MENMDQKLIRIKSYSELTNKIDNGYKCFYAGIEILGYKKNKILTNSGNKSLFVPWIPAVRVKINNLKN